MTDFDRKGQLYVLFVVGVFALCCETTVVAADTAIDSSLGSADQFDQMSVVLTPARLKQAPKQAPASVTLITSAMLYELGIESVPEALRLVPGMAVGMAAGNDYRIGYHGGPGQLPRRMQVLVDGVSVYYGGIARVNWASLPIAIADVDRIEVTRNPNAASYGANSFHAIINIITETPNQSLGTDVSGHVGARGRRFFRIGHGFALGATSIHASAWSNKDEGFDRNTAGVDRTDGQFVRGVRFRTNSALTDTSTLNIMASMVRSDLESEFADANQITFPEIESNDFYFSADWQLSADGFGDWRVLAAVSETQVDHRWESCFPTLLYTQEVRNLYLSNPDYILTIAEGGVPTGGSAEDDVLLQQVFARAAALGAEAFEPNCGKFNQDFNDRLLKFELQNTWSGTERIKTVAGVGAFQVAVESETFFDGSEQGWTQYAFGSLEYTLNNFVVSVGGMGEYSTRLIDEFELSGRMALNWHVDQYQTLRSAYSTATRTPDLLENERNWGFLARDLETPVDGANKQLVLGRSTSGRSYDAEEIQNTELAYLVNYPKIGLQLDTRIFYEKLTQLITGRVGVFDSPPTNDGEVTLSGAEIQAKYTPNKNLTFGFGYAYLDSDTSSTFEKNLFSRHSGHFYGIYRTTDKIQLALAYYGSESISGPPFHKTEATVHVDVMKDTTISLKVTNITKENEFIVNDELSVRNAYDDSTTLTLGFNTAF